MGISDGEGGNDTWAHNTRRKEGLSKLDSRLKSRYFTALESLGISLPEDIPTVRIDRTGYSPDVAKALGPDYLSGHLIFLTEQQEYLETMPREYSNLSSVADLAFEKFRSLVVSVLPNEALIVSTKHTLSTRGKSYDLTAFLESLGTELEFPLLKRGVSTHAILLLHAFTPSKALGAAVSAVETLEEISEKTIDDFLLGERRDELEKCARTLNSLGRRYSMGDMQRLASAPTTSWHRLELPFRYLSQEADVVIDVVPAPEPFLVYMEENQQLAAADGKPFDVIEVSETDRLMEHLFDAGYIEIDSKGIRSRLHELGVEALYDAGYSNDELRRTENNPMMLYQELKKPEVRKHIPKEWFALRDMGNELKGKKDPATMVRDAHEKLAGLYLKISPDSKISVSRVSEKARASSIISTFLYYWMPELEGL